MSAFANGKKQNGASCGRRTVSIGHVSLEFAHVSLACMFCSIIAQWSFISGGISAVNQLKIELGLLAFKAVFEVYCDKWGPDLLVHHLIMVTACGLCFTVFPNWAFITVAMQCVHVPLFFKHAWSVPPRDADALPCPAPLLVQTLPPRRPAAPRAVPQPAQPAGLGSALHAPALARSTERVPFRCPERGAAHSCVPHCPGCWQRRTTSFITSTPCAPAARSTRCSGR